MPFADVSAELVRYLTDSIAFTTTDLPERLEESVPIIHLIQLPGSVRHKPWNGPAQTRATVLDVDLYHRDLESVTDFATEVTDLLESWSHAGITVTEDSSFYRRPDYNPNVVRFGGVYTFLVERT
jgi:hypothetical protein